MLRINRRPATVHPLMGVMMLVASGASFILYHQAVNDPDVGWKRKHEPMANLRWPYNRQYKLYSPTIDFTTLKKPEGNVMNIDDLVNKK